MGPILYRLRPWLRGRWRTAAALVVVVAIAGGLALTLVAGAVRTVTAPDRYSSWRGASFDVSIQQAQGAPRLAELASLPAVKRVEMASFVFGSISTAGGESLNTLVFAGTQGPLGSRLVAGREADATRVDEVLVTKTLFTSTHLHLGDHLELATLTQHQADTSGFGAGTPEGPSLTATIVGVIDGPAQLGDDSEVVLFPARLLDQGDVGISATVGAAALAPGATVDDLHQQVAGLPGGDAFSIDRADWVPSTVRAAVNAQGEGLAILGAIVAVAAVVVLGQLLSRQLRLPEDDRSTLRALGLARSQTIGDPLGRGALLVVAGALGACVLAFLCSGVFPVGFVARVEPHPGLQLDPLVLGLGPLVLVAALLGWVAVTLVLDGRAGAGARGPAAADHVAAALPGAQVSTALRFAFARATPRARSAVTPLLGLGAVFALLFGAVTFGANLDRLADTPALYGAGYDAEVGVGQTQIAPEMQQALAASDDVAGLTLYGETTATVNGTSVAVVGMQPVKGGLLPETTRGRLPQGDSEVALGNLEARDLGVGVGDDITMSGASGERRVHVTGIAVVPPVAGADSIGEAALVTQDGLAALDSTVGMNTATLAYSRSAAPGVQQRVSDLIGQPIGPGDPPPAIRNVERVRNIPALVALAVGVLAALSLANLMLVTVRRRRRDLAILRSLGAGSRWLTGVVHWQATMTTLVVLVIAMPTGTAIGRSIYRRFVDSTGAKVDVIIPLLTIAALAVAVVALVNLVAEAPARRARRVVPQQVLAEP